MGTKPIKFQVLLSPKRDCSTRKGYEDIFRPQDGDQSNWYVRFWCYQPPASVKRERPALRRRTCLLAPPCLCLCLCRAAPGIASRTMFCVISPITRWADCRNTCHVCRHFSSCHRSQKRVKGLFLLDPPQKSYSLRNKFPDNPME